jgi:hypothetical protein
VTATSTPELGLKINVPNVLNASDYYKVVGIVIRTYFSEDILSKVGQAIAQGKGGNLDIQENVLSFTVNKLYLKEALALAQAFEAGYPRGSGLNSDRSTSSAEITITSLTTTPAA